MKKEKEFGEHVKECLTFAQRTTDAILGKEDKELNKKLMLSIFDKCCSPHHYFVQNDEPEPSPRLPSQQPPSEKQIAYAMQLGIKDPENLSKQQLSDEIDKAVQKNKKSHGVN